jgi:hypothetical protein
MDEGLGFGSPSQLGGFWGNIRIRAYFLKEKRPYANELGGKMEVLRNRRIILKVAWKEERWKYWESW